MSFEFVIASICIIVVVNAVVLTLDVRFWRDFIENRGKRHKRAKTDR